jgi:hypothetical protein
MGFGLIAGLVVWSGIVFPPALAIYALINWRGRWRIAAAVPGAMLVALFAPWMIRLRDNPNSTLWGLVFVPMAMALAIFSGAVLLLYRRKAIAGSKSQG